MAEEVDQASIDVIKTLLESKNGKDWFYEYLRKNLSLRIYSDGLHGININISFDGEHVTGGNFSIRIN